MKETEAMRIYAAIDLDACRKNIDAMFAKLRPETKMTLVIKTDGYGHGALPVARLGETMERVWGYAVATAQEAFHLRRNGIRKPILILGYTFEGDYLKMVEEEIRPVVFRYETAAAFSRAAKEAGKTVHIHIGLDTGMHRIGFSDTMESIGEIQKIRQLEQVELEGIFTHFARADEEDKTFARAQLLRFVSFVTKLEKKGITFQLRHAANSASIMEFPEAQIDMVRAGITIYGIYPSEEMKPENLPLKPMMELKSRIVLIKEIAPRDAVSYGGTFVAEKNMRIATISAGYGDGYPRSLSNKGFVLIHGKKAPILGRICMDQFMVDVTDIPEAAELEEVTLMGKDGEAFLPVTALSELAGRFPYEFVCDIGKRVPRVYYQDGKIVEIVDELVK